MQKGRNQMAITTHQIIISNLHPIENPAVYYLFITWYCLSYIYHTWNNSNSLEIEHLENNLK